MVMFFLPSPIIIVIIIIIFSPGDRELVEFLQEEIVAEKKTLQPSLPSHIGDFTVKATHAELTLTRSFHDEKWEKGIDSYVIYLFIYLFIFLVSLCPVGAI